MKHIIGLLLTASILMLLTSCGNKEEIAEELIDYYNNNWIPIHNMKVRNTSIGEEKLTSILVELDEKDVEEISETDLAEIITVYEEDIIPVADRVVNRFDSVHLEYKKVKKLNDLQIEAEDFGRTMLKNGIGYYKGEVSESDYREDVNELINKFAGLL